MGLEAAARRFRRHQLEQRRELGAVRLAGERDPQGHEELRAFAPGALLQYLREQLEIRARLVERVGGGGEEIGPGRAR